MRSLIPCAGCGAAVDMLRAGHVAHLDGQFRYFCGLGCRQRMLRSASERRELVSPSGRRLVAAVASVGGGASVSDEPGDERLSSPGGRLSPAPVRLTPLPDEMARTSTPAVPADEVPGDDDALPDPEPGDVDALLLVTAAAGGVLSLALALLGTTRTVLGARALVAAVGALALAGRAAGPRGAGDGPRWLAVAPVATALLGLAAWAVADRAAADAVAVAAVVVAAAAAQTALGRRLAQPAEVERRWVATALGLPGRRLDRDDLSLVAAHELRPGEFLRVEAGEIVPADLQVTAGEATVLPWLGATTPATRAAGSTLVAGARVTEGAVEGVVAGAGSERAWARLLLDPRHRADRVTATAKLARAVALQGALAAAALGALAVFTIGGNAVEVLLGALAAHAAVGTAAVAALPSGHVLRGVLAAARRGISYRDAGAWDAAARSSVAVYLARGTLLLGEPDVVEIEPAGRWTAPQLLAWVAGAEALQSHPIAHAVQRAARDRGASPDAVRSPVAVPGLGLKSITSTGEVLLIGSRALMLEERVSIALAEARVTELEGLGRTVLLVAIGGRYAGLMALQDGLRPGARASVQHLLDADIEPVLLSGDSRETCETIGRTLDIDHVRPEVLPADRGAEIRRLAEAGSRVAVFGRSADALALTAADVAVALDAAGASSGDWAVSLVGDDIRDAALALTLAHRARADARTALALALAPGVVGALVIAFGLLPPVFAPLSGLVGGALAALHARTTRWPETPLTPWDLPSPALPPGDL